MSDISYQNKDIVSKAMAEHLKDKSFKAQTASNVKEWIKMTKVAKLFEEEKEAALAEKEAELAEKEAVITEKEAVITEKEAVITEKEAELAEKEAEIARLKTLLKQA